jgi:hypothetical protein
VPLVSSGLWRCAPWAFWVVVLFHVGLLGCGFVPLGPSGLWLCATCVFWVVAFCPLGFLGCGFVPRGLSGLWFCATWAFWVVGLCHLYLLGCGVVPLALSGLWFCSTWAFWVVVLCHLVCFPKLRSIKQWWPLSSRTQKSPKPLKLKTWRSSAMSATTSPRTKRLFPDGLTCPHNLWDFQNSHFLICYTEIANCEECFLPGSNAV